MKIKGQKQKVEKKEPVKKDLKTNTAAPITADDEEVNSGFASYLGSATGKSHSIFSQIFFGRFKYPRFLGQETLKLFVIVNSLVMFLTIAWPQMKIAYDVIAEFMNEKLGSVELL